MIKAILSAILLTSIFGDAALATSKRYHKISSSEILNQVYLKGDVESFEHWHDLDPIQVLDQEVSQLLVGEKPELFFNLIMPEDEYVKFNKRLDSKAVEDRIKKLKDIGITPNGIANKICNNFYKMSSDWLEGDLALDAVHGAKDYYSQWIQSFGIEDTICEFSEKSISHEMQIYIQYAENYCTRYEGNDYANLYYDPDYLRSNPEEFYSELEDFQCVGEGQVVLDELFLKRANTNYEDGVSGLFDSSDEINISPITSSGNFEFFKSANFHFNYKVFNFAVYYNRLCNLADIVDYFNDSIHTHSDRKSSFAISELSRKHNCEYEIVVSWLQEEKFHKMEAYSIRKLRDWLESL